MRLAAADLVVVLVRIPRLLLGQVAQGTHLALPQLKVMLEEEAIAEELVRVIRMVAGEEQQRPDSRIAEAQLVAVVTVFVMQ